MKRAPVLLLLLACTSSQAPPKGVASGLHQCADLPAQGAATADEHVIKFELRSAFKLDEVCFNGGGRRVTPSKSGDALVFPLHIKKSVTLAKYHLHVAADGKTLDYDNEIRASKHADDVVKLTVLKKDDQLDATQAR